MFVYRGLLALQLTESFICTSQLLCFSLRSQISLNTSLFFFILLDVFLLTDAVLRCCIFIAVLSEVSYCRTEFMLH